MEVDETNPLFMKGDKTAFNGKIRSYRIELCDTEQSTKSNNRERLQAVLNEKTDIITHYLEEALRQLGSVQATIKVEGSNDEYDFKTIRFKSTKVFNSLDHELNRNFHLETLKSHIQLKFEKHDEKNKGSVHFHYIYLYIHEITAREKPFIDNPEYITSVVNYLNYTAHPVHLDEIPIVEEQNKCSINVYMKKRGKSIGPVYHTEERKEKHFNLLVSEENGRQVYSPYDFSNEFPSASNKQFCDGCFGFYNKDDLARHQSDECMKVKITIPEQTTIKFCDKGYSTKLPFIVYAHFVSLDLVVPESKRQKAEETNNEVWTTNTKIKVPHSYGYYIKCDDNEFCKESRVICWHNECIQDFTKNLVNDLGEQWSKYKEKYPDAYIKHIPVVLQNLEENGNFLVQNSDCSGFIFRLKKYLALFKKSNIGDGARGIDIRFLNFNGYTNEPLEKAVENLTDVGFKDMPLLFEKQFQDRVNKLNQQLIFRNEWLSSNHDLMKEALPPIPNEQEKEIKDIEKDEQLYKYAQDVWESFQCRNMRDYLHVFIKCQIYQVANVIENLRVICMKHYDLDPAHYFTIAGLTWDAMLKMTKVELELLTDPEMIHFIKNGIRGGYSQCNKRHAVANNIYMGESYIETGEISSIMYFDANNLYGHAMCQYLPYGGFRWADTEVDYKVPANSEVGYILEVDLSYPIELHGKHSDLPFCPKKKDVYGANNELLVADLEDKQRYIIHHSYLALCEDQGLKIEKVHRVLEFQQKPWLKTYMDLNSQKRKESSTKFDKSFFKLMNNVIYGKTLVNPTNFSSVELHHDFDRACSSIARPDCIGYAVCSKSTVAVEFKKTNLEFKYPIYVGFSVLDLAKEHMYKFHYNFMKPMVEKANGDLRLLYTDTDSLMYEFKNVDSYKFVKQHVENQVQEIGFDTGNYEKNNKFGIKLKNALTPGFFKDEFAGVIVKEFVGVRSKVYCVHDERGKTKKVAAMVAKNAKATLKLEDFRNCVLNDERIYKTCERSRILDYGIYTQTVKRLVLTPNDPKRYLLPEDERNGKVDSLPFGHVAIF